MNALTESTLADFDAQVADVVAFIDPVYAGLVADDATWNPDTYQWGTE